MAGMVLKEDRVVLCHTANTTGLPQSPNLEMVKPFSRLGKVGEFYKYIYVY